MDTNYQTVPVIDSVSKACAYGDVDKLRAFVEADPTCINLPDEQGYYPLQWAALNNRVAEITYLLDAGAVIDAQDATGQTALHWAAVRGSLPVVETLLRSGTNAGVVDNRGYSICHVAAQYGQTSVLYHLALKWGIDVDVPDYDGRTPLHWAAYKGFADCVRLLLVLDTRVTLADKEGCTPLHWAAIKGNGEACTVLLQGGSLPVLAMRDVTGSTPAQLAVEKGHRYLGLHLQEVQAKGEDSCTGKGGMCAPMAKLQLCPAIWALILGLLGVFVTKVADLAAPGGPAPWLGPTGVAFAWSVVVAGGVGLVFLHRTTTADPGFVPTSSDSSSSRKRDVKQRKPHPGGAGGAAGGGGVGGAAADAGGKGGGGGAGGGGADVAERSKLLDRSGSGGGGADGRGLLDCPALWAGHWQQLCVTCKIVRPLRSKHCSVTGRCVEVFDHYCPWVGNTIGKGNRHWFLVFLLAELYALLTSAALAALALRALLASGTVSGAIVWVAAFLFVDGFVAVSVAVLTVAQGSQVARNVTTNELANWHRYRYLQGPDGRFHNPFSRGVRANCVEAFTPAATPTAPVFLPNSDRLSTGQPPSPCCGGGGSGAHSHHS